MRARFLQRPNRGERPRACSGPNQSHENKGSLEPTRKLKSALARLTALGMTIQWGLIFLALIAVQPCGAMIQSSQQTQSPVVQPTPPPTAAKPASPSSPVLQPLPAQTTPTPQSTPSPSVAQPIAVDAAHPTSGYDEIVITAVGDVMLGTTFPDESTLPPNDGADLLTEVTPFLKRGDVVYGNLEGPIVDGGDSAKCHGKKIGTCFAFRVPTRYGKYLKDAGFTAMGLANNHAMDFGLEGRASSRQVLDAMQIAHTGEVGDIARLTVKGRKIAIIAFATYPGAFNFLDLDESLKTIAQLKTGRCRSGDCRLSWRSGGRDAPARAGRRRDFSG